MIHGITPTLAEGGKIKIGGLGEERKAKSGRMYRVPKKFDHFLITKTTRNDKGDLATDDQVMAALEKEDDGQVRAIPIVLHSDDIDQVFPTAYALYTGRRLACRGDGQTAMRWEVKNGERTGESKERECPCEYLGAESGPICKPHGTLHCSIALPDVAVAGAVHKWRTTSIISIQRMIGSLQQILGMCGTLRGIPLWLKVAPITVSPAGGKATTVFCCHVELRASDILEVQSKALKMAEMRRALGENSGYKLLISPPAGDHETEEEQAEVQQEFHTEAAEATAAAPETAEPEKPAKGQSPRMSKIVEGQTVKSEPKKKEKKAKKPAAKKDVAKEPEKKEEKKADPPNLYDREAPEPEDPNQALDASAGEPEDVPI